MTEQYADLFAATHAGRLEATSTAGASLSTAALLGRRSSSSSRGVGPFALTKSDGAPLSVVPVTYLSGHLMMDGC